MPLLAALLLASCAPAPAVLLSTEAAGLKAVVEAAVPRGTSVLVEGDGHDAKQEKGSVIRLTTTPGWNLPKGAGPAVGLPASWSASYAAAPALAALGRGRDGSWSAVPLLFDPLGRTVFAKALSDPPPSGEWNGILAKSAPGSVVVAGSRPAFRQAAYFLSAYAERPGAIEAASWFSQAPAGWPLPSKTLAPVFSSRAFAPNAWMFSRDDLSMSYKPGELSFFETYRDFESANPPGKRQFAPLTLAQGPSYAMAGIVLFAECRGNPRSARAAGKLVAALDSPAFLKAAGMTGKWLAADRAAPELDSEGALARRLVEGAERFIPLSDRLPEPLVEDCLLVEIQLTPAGARGK
jgi:hypothetical protein